MRIPVLKTAPTFSRRRRRRCVASSLTRPAASAPCVTAATSNGELEGLEIAAPGNDDEPLALSDALDKSAAQNQTEAKLAKLRYFVAVILEEAAAVLGISARTADNYWAPARAGLFRELKAKDSRLEVSPKARTQPCSNSA